jgi:hypothetical protein
MTTMQGPLVDQLFAKIADAMAEAIETGMEPIHAASAVLIVATDYCRAACGDDVVDRLTGTIQMRRGVPIELEDDN